MTDTPVAGVAPNTLQISNSVTLPTVAKAAGVLVVAVGTFWGLLHGLEISNNKAVTGLEISLNKTISELRDQVERETRNNATAIYNLQLGLAVQQTRLDAVIAGRIADSAAQSEATHEFKSTLTDLAKSLGGMEVSLARIGNGSRR